MSRPNGSPSTVAVLHPGRMGAAIAGQLSSSGRDVIYLPTGRSEASRNRATRAGMVAASSIGDLCRQADIILSICAPAAAEDVARLVGSNRFEGIYVEANAISPARFPGIAKLLPQATAVLDGAIFGPPPSTHSQTVLYLAGDQESAKAVAATLSTADVRVEHLLQDPPAASGLKMAHSSYQKASRALAAVAHALALEYDVTHVLLTEAERNSRSPLADPDHLRSVAARAWRWAPELRDAAQTLSDAGLPGQQALAAAEMLDLWADEKDIYDAPLEHILRQLRAPSSDGR